MKYIISIVVLMAAVLMVAAVGKMEYNDEIITNSAYCENVEQYIVTRGTSGHPDYDNNFKYCESN